MANPSLIVLYGQDHSLVETRQWVIESAGLRVSTAVNLIDLESILLRAHVDLLLLCDSLSPVKRKQALDLIHSRRPLVKCLVLTPAVIQRDMDYDGNTFQAGDGPYKLVKMIHQLLAEGSPVTQGTNDQPKI